MGEKIVLRLPLKKRNMDKVVAIKRVLFQLCVVMFKKLRRKGSMKNSEPKVAGKMTILLQAKLPRSQRKRAMSFRHLQEVPLVTERVETNRMKNWFQVNRLGFKTKSMIAANKIPKNYIMIASHVSLIASSFTKISCKSESGLQSELVLYRKIERSCRKYGVEWDMYLPFTVDHGKLVNGEKLNIKKKSNIFPNKLKLKDIIKLHPSNRKVDRWRQTKIDEYFKPLNMAHFYNQKL